MDYSFTVIDETTVKPIKGPPMRSGHLCIATTLYADENGLLRYKRPTVLPSPEGGRSS